jgi:hypothetical protein
MDGEDYYVWFDDVHVVIANPMRLMCDVAGRRVPLPTAVLHPDCTLRQDGDVGRLGVPRWWARAHDLCD